MTGLDTWFGIPKIAPDTEHREFVKGMLKGMRPSPTLSD